MQIVRSPDFSQLSERPSGDGQLADAQALALALTDVRDWRRLAEHAGPLRDFGWGRRITYSRKVFVPLTQLCRDVCHYCTFAKSPRRLADRKSTRLNSSHN